MQPSSCQEFHREWWSTTTVYIHFFLLGQAESAAAAAERLRGSARSTRAVDQQDWVDSLDRDACYGGLPGLSLCERVEEPGRQGRPRVDHVSYFPFPSSL